MKLNLVDAPAKAVVRVQLGRVHVGQPRMGLHFGRSQLRAELQQAAAVKPRRVEFQCVLQRLVGGKQVVVDQRLRLVKDFMAYVHHFPLHQIRSAVRDRGGHMPRSA